MKKIFVMILAALMLMSLAACGQEDEQGGGEQMITQGSNVEQQTIQGNEDSQQTESQEQSVKPAEVKFEMFSYEGVELVPGADFDASKLPEAESSFTAASCAIEGSETTYTYPTFDLTTYDEGSGEYVASILFVDPSLTTPEGLALGDDMAKVVACYGESYTENGTEVSYTMDGVQLAIIVDNDTVTQIEYRIAG